VVTYVTKAEQARCREGLAWERATELGHALVTAVSRPGPDDDKLLFGLEFVLPRPASKAGPAEVIQVGLLAVSFSENRTRARWLSKHLFIFPGLAGGGGFTGYLLDEVIARLRGAGGHGAGFKGIRSIQVELHQEGPPGESRTYSPAKRLELVELVDCYKSRGFKRYIPPSGDMADSGQTAHSLFLDLTGNGLPST
jgi:hypothetical protein